MLVAETRKFRQTVFTTPRPGAAALLAVLPFACSLDERELHPRETVGCANNAATGGGAAGQPKECASGGRSSGGGGKTSSAEGGASTASGGATANAGGPSVSEGGVGGEPSPGCPDLDMNSVADCRETLVENPSFDEDTSSWDVEPDASAEWDAFDGTTQQLSGSILIENRAPVSTTQGQVTKTAAQCISLRGGQSYSVLAQMYIQANEVRGYGLLLGYFYEGEDCSGTLLSTGISPQNGTIQSWRTLGVTLTAPAPARSLLLGLGVSRKSDDAEPFAARFDNILVKKFSSSSPEGT